VIATHEAEVALRFDALRSRFKNALAVDDYRLEAILDASGSVDGRVVLDLGCGKGRFSRALLARGARIVGLDLSQGMIAEAGGIHRVLATARRLPFRPQCFDGIIAVEVFEHLDAKAQETVLLEARRVLRPSGFLAVVDKNVASLSAQRPWIPSVAMKRIDEYRGRWMYPAGGPVRERWFWPCEFKAELQKRFEDVQVFHLLSPAEHASWLFRTFPSARLMTLWVARTAGGLHV
jgi:2-polyprenyl-6-hydroxyphenyl methylase/3-demethylubiquinone-9 3-methyltransferase